MIDRIKKFFDCRPSNKIVVEEPPHGNRMEESVQMKALYSLVVRYINRSKAYLDPDLKVKELARSIHTNRLYLSRTINFCSGMNFKQFMNWYRILHAANLIKADRRLKFEEIAKMSGFNSQPTFNLAFKYHMHMTPTEYQSRLRRKSSRYPVRIAEPVQVTDSEERPSNFPEQEP